MSRVWICALLLQAGLLNADQLMVVGPPLIEGARQVLQGLSKDQVHLVSCPCLCYACGCIPVVGCGGTLHVLINDLAPGAICR